MNSERGQPVFPYHYGFEAESYTFYRVPKVLFTEPEFKALSTGAMLLYGLLLDRMQLSLKNNWVDEDGRVYIFFTVEAIMEALSCGNKKAGQLLAELDERKGIGLISRVRQGMGRPDRIYVHKCITEDMSKRHFKTCQNDTSRDVEMTCHDMSKRHPNKTDKNNTDKKDIYPIVSDRKVMNKEDDDGKIKTEHSKGYAGEHDRPVHPKREGDCSIPPRRTNAIDGMDQEGYLKYFEESLSLDALKCDFPYQKDQLEEIKALLAEVCSTKKEWIRIAGSDRSAAEVRRRFMSLNSEHVRYVLESIKETTTRVRNIRQYLLAALYNAPLTISSYYDALVRHDMYGKGGG